MADPVETVDKLTSKIQELEDKLKQSDSEKGSIKAELDSLKKKLQEAEDDLGLD